MFLLFSAHGVRMCSPDKGKWLVRFCVPVYEALIRHQKPHFVFHLGTNNILSLKSKAPKVVINEAKELLSTSVEFKQDNINYVFCEFV